MSNTISAKDVGAYLQANPAFFCDPQRRQLLEQLRIPHADAAGHISLLEHQVISLRRSRDELTDRCAQLFQILQTNDQTKAGFIAVLDKVLLAATSRQLLANMPGWLQEIFHKLDDVFVMLSQSDYPTVFADKTYKLDGVSAIVSDKIPQEIANGFRTRQHQIGDTPSEALCGQFRHKETKSFLFLPDATRKAGLLLGSKVAGRFASGLNADLIKVITRMMLQRLDDLLCIEKLSQQVVVDSSQVDSVALSKAVTKVHSHVSRVKKQKKEQ